MDKGDKNIRQKVSQAKPYKPRADWDKMEAMLDATEASSGNRYVFLKGFLLGAASLALLMGCLWFSGALKVNAPIAKLEMDTIDSCLDLEETQEGRVKLQPLQANEAQTILESLPQMALESASKERLVAKINPSSIQPSPTRNESTDVQKKDLAQISQKEQKGLRETPILTFREKDLAKHTEVQPTKVQDTELENVDASHLAVDRMEGAEIILPQKIDPNLGLSLADGDFHPEGVEHIFPEPIFPTVKDKKWSAGVHLIGLVEPYVASSPISIEQNPFLYRWHPGVAVELNRKIKERWKLGLRAGSDDAYYYKGYIPEGGYEPASLNELGNSVAVIVGTNHWLELSAKLKMRKKKAIVFDPYARAGLGHVWSKADFLSIFGVNSDQLSNTEKSSRFQAKENLNTFIGNPYLVNNRTYVDASNSASLNSEQALADFSVQNNLSEYVQRKFISTSFGIGAEIHLGSSWDIDIQANVLSRLSQVLFIVPVEQISNDYTAISSSTPRLAFPEQTSFVQLSAGMNYRF